MVRIGQGAPRHATHGGWRKILTTAAYHENPSRAKMTKKKRTQYLNILNIKHHTTNIYKAPRAKMTKKKRTQYSYIEYKAPHHKQTKQE